VADAFQKNCDVAIVVSADSDMTPAIELAKEAKLKIYIYFPPNQFSSNLSTMGNSAPVQMQRFETRFKSALMNDQIQLSSGFVLSKPEEWK
jgi:ABC-type branched-subunit amino acid transport system substrate-binding protein